MKKDFIGPLLIIIAGIFWGSMGIFVRRLSEYGFDSMQITALRLTAAALMFIVILLIKEPSGFKIKLSDVPLFLGLGLASVLFFTICYFTAMSMMPLSSAAILLYTSPIWVMLMSMLFFKEKLNGAKLCSLALAFAGCALVSGISGGGISPLGLVIGLGSGIGYGLYSILGTLALKKYSSYVVTGYTFIIAAIGSWFICRPAELAEKFSAAAAPWPLLLLVLLTGLISAVIPFTAYTLGLKTVKASKAAILATIEPLVATLIGVLIFNEALSLQGIIGIALILVAINIKTTANTDAAR